MSVTEQFVGLKYYDHLVSDRGPGSVGDGGLPAQREVAVGHAVDDGSVGQRHGDPSLLHLVEV